MAKIKILHIITGLGPGGAEKVVFDLCRKANLDEFELNVISLNERKELLKRFIDNGINTFSLEMKRSFFDTIRVIKYISKFIKENKIDVIHAHMTHGMIITGILKFFFLSIPVVFTSHSINIGSKTREIILQFLKPMRSVDIVFSKKMNNSFYKKNKRVIPNGIETKAYSLELKKFETFTFIAIGRIEYVKNHILLIDAAKKLHEKMKFEILIIGDGILRKELEEKVKDEKLENYVKFIGFRNDIPELCDQSHAFLMPSHWEGFPISMLEAGASGLPIISTPVGSIPSLIHEDNGYLAEQKDFAKKMEYVFNNYEEASKKGKRLKNLIQSSYDIDTTVKKHEEIYKELILKS